MIDEEVIAEDEGGEKNRESKWIYIEDGWACGSFVNDEFATEFSGFFFFFLRYFLI